jgi:HlyD family secretion protein
MDIPRPDQTRKKNIRRLALVSGLALAVLLITLGLNHIEPAAPAIERETLWTGKVRRGTMQRQVRGPGTLVPEDVRIISAQVEGRVESIPSLPGVTLEPDTILLEMSDPSVMQQALEAEAQLKAAEADAANLAASVEGNYLNQQALLAAAQSASEQAKLQMEADEKLAKDGLIPELNLKISRLTAEQRTRQAAIEDQRLKQIRLASDAQLAAQRARVEQMRTLFELRRRMVDSLKVRAGIAGVLQDLPVQVGQRVAPGTTLARVASPEKLKAELRIPETQAKDVVIGLDATIDTRNGEVAGKVTRVAPSVQDGTVTVDVALVAPLPKGARPDLSVDGTIEIERLDNVVYIEGRPAYGQPHQKIEMFKLVKNGKEAVRVLVELGRASVNSIEVVSGLAPGDEVILSDTSQQDDYRRLRIQ